MDCNFRKPKNQRNTQCNFVKKERKPPENVRCEGRGAWIVILENLKTRERGMKIL